MATGLSLQEYTVETDLVTDFAPVLIREIELGEPLPALSGLDKRGRRTYKRACCLVRLHRQPLGLVDFALEEGELLPNKYVEYIWQVLGERINAHLREDGLPEVRRLDAAGVQCWSTPRCLEEYAVFLQTLRRASIVLSTRERPDRLARCLPSLLAQEYPDYEIVVVDNAPLTSATADLIQRVYADEPRIRYVREDRPGLSLARNRGILEACGEIIAFTDDDVVVDAHWLANLVKGFGVAENVACVTSLVLPLELETPTQVWFEEFGGFNRGFIRRVFDRTSGKSFSMLYPFTAGVFGAGAAMAFTAKFLREEGGFDPALGAGTPTGGGEDLVAFFQVIMRGNRLVYEPASLAYHEHRRDYGSLQKQMYGYGTALTAYLTKVIVDNPLYLLRLFMLMPAGLVYVLSAGSDKNRKKSAQFPRELVRLERRGMWWGPFLYFKTRRNKL